MEQLFKGLLALHIIGGATGLISGMFNMIATKGTSTHKLVGKIFTLSMLTAGLSSLVMSVMHPNHFLFMVGIFTVYMVVTGNRYLHLKSLSSNQKPKTIDWFMTIAMLMAGILFIGLGVLLLLKSKTFGLVFITFGLLGLQFVRHDFINYRGHSGILNYWLSEHLQRMTGAFIASFTAFLVVNAKYFPAFIPGFIYWLLPTFILTPLIIKWSRKYEVKKQ